MDGSRPPASAQIQRSSDRLQIPEPGLTADDRARRRTSVSPTAFVSPTSVSLTRRSPSAPAQPRSGSITPVRLGTPLQEETMGSRRRLRSRSHSSSKSRERAERRARHRANIAEREERQRVMALVLQDLRDPNYQPRATSAHSVVMDQQSTRGMSVFDRPLLVSTTGTASSRHRLPRPTGLPMTFNGALRIEAAPPSTVVSPVNVSERRNRRARGRTRGARSTSSSAGSSPSPQRQPGVSRAGPAPPLSVEAALRANLAIREPQRGRR